MMDTTLRNASTSIAAILLLSLSLTAGSSNSHPQADIVSSNGIIHVIDSVIVPQ